MQVEGDDELDDMHQQGQVGYLGSVAIGQTLGTEFFITAYAQVYDLL